MRNEIKLTTSQYTKKLTKLTLSNKTVFDIFVHAGEVTEVRILNAHGKSPAWGNEWVKGIVSGYFDDHEAFCNAVTAADKSKHGGIYFTLQVIDPRLLGRAVNRLKPSNVTTSDQNVISYRWLPIDIDPVRPSGVSSSVTELEKALAVRDKVAAWVIEELKFTPPIKALSGNGGHLLFRLPDLPVNEKAKSFIKNTLEGLAKRFNTDKVSIDTGVFNPARIWKLYGTISRKGDPVPPGPNREARVHRMAYIDDFVQAQPLSRASINNATRMFKPKNTVQKGPRNNDNPHLNVERYLGHYGVAFHVKEKDGSTFYCLDTCVFDSSHTNNDSSIIQRADGMLFYQCFHESCKGRMWKDARQKISGGDKLLTFSTGVQLNDKPY